MGVRHFGKIAVETGNEDKVLFPGAGITKGELIDYYVRVAGWLLPHANGRPLTLRRFPDGIGRGGFFQKEASDYFPDWIPTVRVGKSGGVVNHVVCDKKATLAYLANQACITPHIWLSRADRPRMPDQLVFDLDPEGGAGQLQFAARVLRGLFEELGLAAFVKTTGSRGVHLAVPLRRRKDFDEVRHFARGVAALAAHRHPDRLTTEVRKNKRNGRLFLDTARNAYAQTIVCPYGVRARPGAPVAVPLDWKEALRKDFEPQRFTVRNVFRRLGQKADPWQDMGKAAGNLDRAWRTLAPMLEEARLEGAY